MRMSNGFLVALVFLFAAGCSFSGKEKAGGTARVYSPSELNASPVRFDRREVMVKGFILLSSNSHSIYESEELFEEFSRRLASDNDFEPEEYDKYCLTIANPDQLRRDPERYKGKTLTFRGEFVKDYLGGDVIDLGACANPSAIVIDALTTQDQD